MTAIPLTSGAYSAQSLISNAQRSVNVYPEINPKNTEPNQPVTHYVRPGLRVLCAPAAPGGGPAPIPPDNNFLADESNTTLLDSGSGTLLTSP